MIYINLKLNGFREEILVTVYRRHVLSHHNGYSSPIFISVTAAIRDEMKRGAFKIIIGINEKVALEKHNIGTMRQFIEHKICVNRMLYNPEHELVNLVMAVDLVEAVVALDLMGGDLVEASRSR